VNQTLVLYAPNVHNGGGLVLLRALLAAWPGVVPLSAFLDERALDRLSVPSGATVSWVAASIGSRLKAEFGLSRAAKAGSTVLCFHGLPPVLSSVARVIVFQQNRLYVDSIPLSRFAWKTRLRLAFERIVSRVFHYRVSQYFVQTPSMEHAVVQWCAAFASGSKPAVKVMPFVDALPAPRERVDSAPEWDFVYVADGEAHKNHRVLLAAWQLLAQEGLRPSLALTLGARDEALMREIEAARDRTALRITNLGQMLREDVLELYARAGAMIFPSTSESFGLPMVEAAHLGLPILASELDFVREVCVPAHTFDPLSPVSIARAVKRFMGQPEAPLTLRTPAEFWDKLLADECPRAL
jgi:glycosyltransferase involved in cell wall biosynthesis